MFWNTYLGLQIPLDQLKLFDGCLVGFIGDQVEVRGYIELRMTFSNENVVRIIGLKQEEVNCFWKFFASIEGKKWKTMKNQSIRKLFLVWFAKNQPIVFAKQSFFYTSSL